jgi:sodium/potassium-transporting ATPase subunit beta
MSETKRRRDTTVEESEVFIDPKTQNASKKAKRNFGQVLSDLGRDLYNSETREFLSRDAKAWCQLSLFYFVFYVFLSAFFILLLMVFYSTLDLKQPRYFNKDSVMNYADVNPGLGFRPQLDPESELIYVNSSDFKENYQSLDLFMQHYERNKNKTFTGAHGRKIAFDYEEIINGTPCARNKHYGYSSQSPCVVVKLNRIFGWLPKIGASSKYPFAVAKAQNSSEKFIYVHCTGERGADKDNIGPIDYYSTYSGNDVGGISFRYFPFRNQDNYLSPLVFVHFKNISRNTLVNVECKGFAGNIDHNDRRNKRGLVKFQLFVTK